MNLRELALNILASNPQLAQNPNAQSMIDVIRRGDATEGQRIAQNICDSYGITPEQAINQAKNLFHL